MFSAFGRKKALSRPFVFSMFSALGKLSMDGRNVATEFGGIEAGKVAS
jgi:hypothetical protein